MSSISMLKISERILAWQSVLIMFNGYDKKWILVVDYTLDEVS